MKIDIAKISGISQYELENEIDSISKNYGIPQYEVADTLLEDIQNEKFDKFEDVSTVENKKFSDSLSTSKKISSSVKGDIWYSRATTSFYNHGQVGLYQTGSRIIEARRVGYRVGTRSVSSINVKKGDIILGLNSKANSKVRVSQTI